MNEKLPRSIAVRVVESKVFWVFVALCVFLFIVATSGDAEAGKNRLTLAKGVKVTNIAVSYGSTGIEYTTGSIVKIVDGCNTIYGQGYQMPSGNLIINDGSLVAVSNCK